MSFYSLTSYSQLRINQGALNGGTPTPPPFVNSQSILLDGVDDYVSVPNSTSLNITTAMSVSFWFKTTSSTAMYPLTQGSGSQIKYYVQFYAPINRIRILIFDGSAVTIALDNTQVFDDGQWHNLTFTTDALTTTDGVKVYFDGNLLTNKGTLNNNGIRTASSGLFIGQIPNTARFNGLIDEVSLFNTQLSQSDVTSIYGSGIPSDISSISGLVSWWRFEGSGTTATDRGRGGNNGTLINGVVRSTDVPTIPFSTKSIILDGVDDYVTMGNVLNMANDGTTPFSTSFWINSNSLALKIVMSKQNNSGAFNGLSLLFNSGKLDFYFGTNTANAYLRGRSTNNVVGAGWRNVILTYDGSQDISGFNIYINGVSDAVVSLQNNTPTDVSNSADFQIAGRGGTSFVYAGGLDEVAFWNGTELTSTQANEIGGTIPTDLSTYNPTSWWRFEGSGTTATDSGSGGNNGTLINGVTRSTDVPT